MLLIRALAGMVFLLVVLGLALFLPAGSLNYWQAWGYLADFAICTILITVWLFYHDQRLLAARTQAGPVSETQKTQQVIQGIASLCFIGMFVVPGLDYRNHWTTVPLALTILSYILVALGFYSVFLVFRENTYTSGTIEVVSEQKVVDTGPYAIVRHPMYAGAGILVLFTSTALGSWLGIPLALILMLVIAARLLDEEKFLTANLPGYEAYMKKVRFHLIPYVW